MTIAAGGRSFGVSALLLVIAIVIFVLAAFNVHLGSLNELDLTNIGLAVFAGSFLVP